MFVAALMLPWLGAYPVRLMLLTKAPLAVTGVATSLILRWIYRALLQRRASGWTLAATAMAASAGGALVWNVAGARMVALVAPGIEERGTVIRASLDRVDSTVYYVLVLLAWSMLYLGITHYRALQAERERSLRAEALAHEARLRALRYQVNPHLLFNTLNAISTLVVERRTADASRMIARLSDFLRVTLDGPEHEEVALANELEHLACYLEIERVRFADRLTVRFNVDETLWAARVPNMILQPLVENAVRHAVSRREEGGAIIISATGGQGVLRLAVTDDGPGLAGAATDGQGIGLVNTRARLAHCYGDAQQLELVSLPNGGTRAEMELPLRFGAVVTAGPMAAAASGAAAS